MCGSKPDVDTSYQDQQRAEAERLRVEEEARQGRIATGMARIGEVFSGIDPLVGQRREAMEGFYLPQLDDKFSDAKDDLTFALARSGQLTSSTAGDRQADLGEAFALQRAQIEGDINSDISGFRTNINNQRSALEAGLRASGDATAASNAALAAQTAFVEDAPTLNPIGDVFYGLAQGIGAARDGFDAGTIRRSISTASPLSSGTGRVVTN